MGILLLSKPQFGKREMRLSQWEREGVASRALLRVCGSYESVGPDAFDLWPSLDIALLYMEGTEDMSLILES